METPESHVVQILCKHIYACTHAFTHMHTNSHTFTHIHTHSHTFTHMCIHILHTRRHTIKEILGEQALSTAAYQTELLLAVMSSPATIREVYTCVCMDNV